MKIVAVVAISHHVDKPDLALSNLEQGAMLQGVDIKVECIRPSGVENELDEEDIREADAVIVAADDSNVEMTRFVGKPLRTVSLKDAAFHAVKIIQDAQTGKFETYNG